MIFTGNAAELATLTLKHLGSEWWPGIEFGKYGWHRDLIALDLRDAASIIFAAAWVWLAVRGYASQLFPPTEWKPRFSVKVHIHERNSVLILEGPSPLHAVLAAVEACK